MSGFRTRIDYSDNRQITQRQLTSTDLSGTTVFGGEFSDLPSGVNWAISKYNFNVYWKFIFNNIYLC